MNTGEAILLALLGVVLASMLGKLDDIGMYLKKIYDKLK